MERIDLSERELQSKAEAYCAKGERCASQVMRKIADWGGDRAQAERIVGRLENERYLSGARFCRAFAHDKLLYQGWGRYKIGAALRQLDLAEVEIEEALKNLDSDEYNQVLTKVAKQKKGVSEEQLNRFLLQRGFSYEEIRNLSKRENE